MMRRFARTWLSWLLCLALLGGVSAALADGVGVELADGVEALADGAPLLADGTAPELALDDLGELQPSAGGSAGAARSNAARSNAVVVNKYLTFKIEAEEAILASADRKILKADIPAYVDDLPVTRIADDAFANCTKLWSVTVPETVTEIGERAFSGCGALVEVNIADSVEKIGKYAFKDCVTISHLVLPRGLEKISAHAFENCQMLWKLAIPDGVRSIGNSAFYRCLSLKEFTLPQGLKVIHDSAFELCESMSGLVIPDGVEWIGQRAFMDCVDLRKLTLPDSLTHIGSHAFRNCDSLRALTLPRGLEFIGRFAFARCEDLTAVTIPGSVDIVYYGAFCGCSLLEKVTVKSGVKKLSDYCFAQCKALTRVAIPESVKKIGKSAFTVGAAMSIVDDKVEQTAPLRNPGKLKIYGRPDSAAQKHAASRDIPFVIQKILATGVSIAQGESLTLYVGHPVKLDAVQTPSNAETTVSWKSSSSAVSVSKSGVLTPKHSGKATVTARTENGKTAKITVTVVDARRVTITNGDTLTLKVGVTLQLYAEVSPKQVDTRLTWKSYDKKIATVDSAGLVTAKRKGTVRISVKTANGKKDTIKIKVVP